MATILSTIIAIAIVSFVTYGTFFVLNGSISY